MNPPPRLAVYLPHLRVGGGELSMLRLAAGLARGGLAVDLLVNTLATAELAPPAGLRLTELGGTTKSGSTGNSGPAGQSSNPGSLGSVRGLAHWLQLQQPRWLLSAFPHSNVTAVAALAWSGADCRCVLSEHAPLSLQIKRQGGWRYRVLPPLVRWAYHRADAVVAVSAGVREDLLALAGPRLRLHTIANPVLDDMGLKEGASEDSASTVVRSSPLHPWLLDPALRVVLSVSRLSSEKGIPTLLRAFAHLHAQQPQSRLLLAGEGPERAGLEALMAELRLGSVAALAGHVNAPRAWMRQAAVFALASEYEGFGNVLVEALAGGTAVVSTDCPVGPREVLAGGRWGRLVPVGDWRAMAAALRQALDKPGAPAGAVAYAAQFTDSAACAAYRRLLDSLGPRRAARC